MSYMCGSFAGVLGFFEHSDIWSRSGDMITIFYPQDTGNKYPQYTLTHELTHRDLVKGSLIGGFQTMLAAAGSVSSLSENERGKLSEILIQSMKTNSLIHESIATYVGLMFQSSQSKTAVNDIYQRLPPLYRDAVSVLETIFPNHTEIQNGSSLQYHNILLALGKFCLNTRLIQRLADTNPVGLIEPGRLVNQENPDQVFQSIITEIQSDKRIFSQLLDIVYQTAIETIGQGRYQSFEELSDTLSRLAVDDLKNFLNTLDRRLTNELFRMFPNRGCLAISYQDQVDILENVLKKWNAIYEKERGFRLFPFNGVVFDANEKPRIRTLPQSPETQIGNRPFSRTPHIVISETDLQTGARFARSIRLWFQIRLFVNPTESELPLGQSSPALKSKHCVLVIQPWFPSEITAMPKASSEYMDMLKNAPLLCRMPSSIWVKNSQIPVILEWLDGITIFWHIDWIMYHFAQAAGMDYMSFPGHKYIHLDNADDETFMELLKNVGKQGPIEAYVQYHGNNTLLIAMFYQVGSPVYYSMPIPEHKYTNFLESISAVSGNFKGPQEGDTIQNKVKNDLALNYHYGL